MNTACQQAVGGAGWRFRLPKQVRSRLGSLKMEFDAAKIDLARTYFAVSFVQILDLGNKAHAKFITLGVSALWLAFEAARKWVTALWLAFGVALTMRLVPTGHLLFFASPKKSKQKKGDPDVQFWLRQTSLTAHPFFGACELAALCASSDKRTLFSEKRMLRSAGRRGEGSSSKQLRSVR